MTHVARRVAMVSATEWKGLGQAEFEVVLHLFLLRAMAGSIL
jgi:hypothetical protein